MGQYRGSTPIFRLPLIVIYQLPGANAIAIADQVYKMMQELNKTFPKGLEYKINYDSTLFVRESIHEVTKTLYEAVILVILVVFIFLQNWRATLIPLLTVPVSLIGTFILFPILGFSVNVLTLFGLVLAIGIVVDDAIVVVEAVEHNMAHRHMSPKEATLRLCERCPGHWSPSHWSSWPFFSRWPSSGDQRSHVSAICADHRRLCRLLCLQRPHSQSRPQRLAPQAR